MRPRRVGVTGGRERAARRVVGTVVASRKEPTLEGLKFLVIKQIDVDESDDRGHTSSPPMALVQGWVKW